MVVINKLRGLVERITYKNEENGYSVIKIRVKGSKEYIAAIGKLSDVNVGSIVTLYGGWEKNIKYGNQFKVERHEESLPSTIYGIEKYLGSCLINGVGPKYANKIVRYFGEETLKIIEECPERLSEIEGLGRNRIEKIKISWNEHKYIKQLMIFGE